MRIMYFLDYAKMVGGAVNTLIRQALLMKKKGHQVFFVVSDYMGREMPEEFFAMLSNYGRNVLCLTYPISYHTEDIDIVSVIENYDEVKKAIQKYRPDLMHSVQLNPIVELIGREMKIPHIMDIYQALPEFFNLDYLNIFAHYHICDSQLYADMWSKGLGTESRCIRTVVFDEMNCKKAVSDGENTEYICVGAVDKRKNQLEVIKAFHKALEHGISGTLAIYGYAEGKYAEDCKQYVLDHNLSQKIKFEGFCQDMRLAYEKGEALICGSTIESYPNVISEALASGTVIISVPVAGVPEVISDGVNGFLCKGFEAEDILYKILEYEEKKKTGQLLELRNRAYETYHAVHDPEAVAFQLEKFYVQIMRKSENPYEKIQIGEVREKFIDIWNIYKKNIDKFREPEAVKRKLWYLFHIQDQIKRSGKKIYIWGTGAFALTAKSIFDIFFPERKPEGFLDSHKEGYFFEYAIYHPKQVICNEGCMIFVAAVNGQHEMVEELQKAGKECNRDYFILAERLW